MRLPIHSRTNVRDERDHRSEKPDRRRFLLYYRPTTDRHHGRLIRRVVQTDRSRRLVDDDGHRRRRQLDSGRRGARATGMGVGQVRQRPAGLAPVRPAAVLPETRPVPGRRPGTRVRARQLRRRLRRRTSGRLRRRRGRRRRSNVLGRRLVVLGRRRRPLRSPTPRPRRPEDFYVRTGGPGRLSRTGCRVRYRAGTLHRSDVPVRARQMAVPPAGRRLIAIGTGGPVKVRFDCNRINTATTC